MKMLARLSRPRVLGVLLALVSAAVLLSRSGGGAAKPTTERLAFLRLTGEYWQVWVMDIDGGNARQLTTSPLSKQSPSWCPGNGVIHYFNDAGHAWLVDVATGREEIQGGLLPRVLGPRTSDGRHLPLPEEWQRRLDPHGDVRLVCGDPEDPLTETITIYEFEDRPGHAMAIQRRQTSRADELFDMEVVDLNLSTNLSTGLETSFGTSGVDTKKVVSGKGETVVVRRRRDADSSEVWLVAADGTREQLTQFDARTDHPTWSADGKWLLFDTDAQGTDQIFRVSLTGRTVFERISDGISPSKHPVVSRPTVGGE